MSAVETVRVAVDWRDEGWVLINRANFDSAVHKLWTEPKAEPDSKETAPPAA